MIEEDDVADFMERYHSLVADRRLWPSFFELTTIMAFDCFARHNVDVSVVETGLEDGSTAPTFFRPTCV